MSTDGKPAAVPVDLLCSGLYVVRLDRPWIETPFLFQGFRIDGEEELAILREYCRRVYVDVRRSDPRAIERLKAVAAQRRRANGQRRDANGRTGAARAARDPRLAMPSERALDKSAGVLLGNAVKPDRKHFRIQVEAAMLARHHATQAVVHAIQQARSGRALDVTATRDAVARMTERIVADPTASLWLSQLREHHDREARHAVNSCVLTLAFGAHLRIDGRELRSLGLGALLHDIGKTRIPPAVLDKAEPLTEHEREVLRRHPDEGHDLLLRSGQLEREVLDIVRLHHERWLGQGYPDGRLGETIPRPALIVGLVDSYDAMTSDRPWRAAMTPERALHTLYGEAADTFGVDLVQALIRCLGIFPVGSVVELDNGACGIVVGARPGSGIWPTVLLVRDPDGRPYHRRVLLNLGAEARRRRNPTRVRRAIEPAAIDLDVGAVVEQEFGLARTIAA